MASNRFKKVLAIRFISNLVVITAIISLLFEFGPILGTEISYRKDQILGIHYSLDSQGSGGGGNDILTPIVSNNPQTGFGTFMNIQAQQITPVDPDYGIVIEKINANAKVIADVDPNNEAEYSAALAKGVAAVKGTTEPGQPGNLYIFSHSTDAPWNIVRFNAIFYLLRELDKGDRVVIFYKGRRYDYIVYDKQITDPHNIDFLKNRYDQPVLTLQTCDPPGTLLHRLIVRAKLEGY